jgi:VWFA-related protein
MPLFRSLTIAAAVLAAIVARPAPAQAQDVRQLFVTVLDQAGQPVLDLTPDEFTLEEDGAPRRITRATLATDPMRIVLLVDNGDSAAQLVTQMREALHAFLDGLPPQAEVLFATTGRQLRIRERETTDRGKIHKSVDNLFPDTGAATVLLDSLRETWDRFLKKADGYWPVFVVVTTDGTEGSNATQQQQWDQFVGEIQAAGASVHAAVVQLRGGSLTTQIAMSLTATSGGKYSALAASTGLTAALSAIAARLTADDDAIRTRYLVRYESQSKTGDANVGLRVARDGITLRMAPDRRTQ